MSDFRFYLGTHQVAWLERLDVPLFVSRRRLVGRKTLPTASTRWALDSGGFTELDLYGEWRTTEDEYVADVRRFVDEIGRLDWVAPQDWMCEPFMLNKTKNTVETHQRLTVRNFLRLRDQLGRLVIPVLQGWTLDDYLRCWSMGKYPFTTRSGWSAPNALDTAIQLSRFTGLTPARSGVFT